MNRLSVGYSLSCHYADAAAAYNLAVFYLPSTSAEALAVELAVGPT